MGRAVDLWDHPPNIDHTSSTSKRLDSFPLEFQANFDYFAPVELDSSSPSIFLKSSFDNFTNSPAMQSRTRISHFVLSFSKSSDLQLAFILSNSERRCCFLSTGGSDESTKLSSQELVVLPSFSSTSSSSSGELFVDFSANCQCQWK